MLLSKLIENILTWSYENFKVNRSCTCTDLRQKCQKRYNISGHKCVWAQTCVGTNVCGHNRVWAQSCGHKCVWAQTCLGTIVCGHNRVGSIMYGPNRGGTIIYYKVANIKVQNLLKYIVKIFKLANMLIYNTYQACWNRSNKLKYNKYRIYWNMHTKYSCWNATASK